MRKHAAFSSGPALLLRQSCLLAGAAGVMAAREFWPGALFWAFALALELSSIRAGGEPHAAGRAPASGFFSSLIPSFEIADVSGRTGLLLLCFLCGAGYAALRAPSSPACPDWLEAAASSALTAGGEERPPAPVRIRARVERAERLPGDRLRLLLRDARPAAGLAPEVSGANASAVVPYAGRIAWTWTFPQSFPLPGQEVEISLRLERVRGVANFGQWSLEDYWHDRRVWFRGWSRGGKADARVYGGASFASGLRAALEERFDAALPRREAEFPPRREAEYPANSSIASAPLPLTPGAGLLPALVFGDRSHISREDADRFARATLTHSLSLSGLHLAYAAGLGWLLALGLGRCVPGLWLRVARPRLAVLLALPLAGGYLWLGQAPVSLQRAACMLLFGAVLLLLNRPKALLDGLLAALALLLALDPDSMFDLGLQLSVLSVAVLALSLPRLESLARFAVPSLAGPGPHRKDPPARRLARWAILLGGTSLCIQIVLAPLAASVFGTVGLWFPLNLVWLPVLGAVVMPPAFAGLALSAAGAALPASWALHLASLPCDALIWLMGWMDRAGLLAAPVTARPHWVSMAGYWTLCLGLPVLFLRLCDRKKPWRAALGDAGRAVPVVCLGCLLLAAPWLAARHAEENGPPAVRLRLLDVGQGQAVLVEWQGLGARGGPAASPPGLSAFGRLLVDGGGSASGSFDPGKAVIAPILAANAPPSVDWLVNSHPDADHLGGLLYLLENFRVDRYAGNGDVAAPALAQREEQSLRRSGLERETWKEGDRLRLGPGLCLEVLWPPARERTQKGENGGERGNNRSLVLRLVWEGEPLALLCGDAEEPVLRQLTEKRGKDLRAGVLVLPHHGSARSLSVPFYRAVAPEAFLVSCGYGNQWGFPSGEVRRSAAGLGIPLYSTARHGQIFVEWTGPGGPFRLDTARVTK